MLILTEIPRKGNNKKKTIFTFVINKNNNNA